MKRRSIGQRMTRIRSLAMRREAALDWATSWQRDHEQTLASLERALGRGDTALAGRYVGQLKALHEKGMTGLYRVIEGLSDEDAE